MDKLNQELRSIEHDYLVNKLIMIIKNIDYSEYEIVEKTIETTHSLIDNYSTTDESTITYNIIDNNIFEMESIISDIKVKLEGVVSTSTYLYLINKDINYLKQKINKLLTILNDHTINEVKCELNLYMQKIIDEYTTSLNVVLVNNNLTRLVAQLDISTIKMHDLDFIYKVTNNIQKELESFNINSSELKEKQNMFEFMYLVLKAA